LSTLHTNDATGAISRLQDMGVENFLISSALVGVMSQRLVRKICKACNGAGEAGGVRCRSCNGTGYKGRVGIFEYLRVNDDIRKLISGGADNATLSQTARANGMRTLREDGNDKADQGLTTAAEVARVCQLDVG
jgi:type II secretory ATPase GspE/PulE/Tfp pilus assembly ATPase PilB-like protein